MKNQPDNHPESPSPEKHRETPIGRAVQYFRTELDISQEELSKECDLGRNAINEIERGVRKKVQRRTVSKIVLGLNALGLEITTDEFDAKVYEYKASTSAKANLNNTDSNFKPDTAKGKHDLTGLAKHIPSARKIITQIARSNSEMRFVRGMTNTLNRIEKMADPKRPFELESFCTLMKQLDSFVQEIECKNLQDAEDIYSLKSLREKLSIFEAELGKFYPEFKDGVIPNDWPCENIRHQGLIDNLFGEILQRKLKIEDIEDTKFRIKAFDALEELEIELDRNPLHLKNINIIRARLEELDRDIFRELLISSQLLLGIYAGQLPPGSIFRDAREAPEMVIVAAGEFWAGKENVEDIADELPRQKVVIPNDFAVGRYPITFEEWDWYRKNNRDAHNPNDHGFGRSIRPVINISWDDTRGFVNWLRLKTGKSYRLLSEMEWQYSYSHGENIEFYLSDNYSHANKGSNILRQVESELGTDSKHLLDYILNGKFREWCEDCWQDRTEVHTSIRVLRGGANSFSRTGLNPRYRTWVDQSGASLVNGFRVTRSLISAEI